MSRVEPRREVEGSEMESLNGLSNAKMMASSARNDVMQQVRLECMHLLDEAIGLVVRDDADVAYDVLKKACELADAERKAARAAEAEAARMKKEQDVAAARAEAARVKAELEAARKRQEEVAALAKAKAKEEAENKKAAMAAARAEAAAVAKAEKEAKEAAARELEWQAMVRAAEKSKAEKEARDAIAKQRAQAAAEARANEDAQAAARAKAAEEAAEAKAAATAQAKVEKNAARAAAKAEAEAARAAEEAAAAIAKEQAQREAEERAKAKADAQAQAKAAKAAEVARVEEERQRKQAEKSEEAERRKAEAQAAKAEAERMKAEAAAIAKQMAEAEIAAAMQKAMEQADAASEQQQQVSQTQHIETNASAAAFAAQARLERSQSRFPGLRRRSEDDVRKPTVAEKSRRRSERGQKPYSSAVSTQVMPEAPPASVANPDSSAASASGVLSSSAMNQATAWLSHWRDGNRRSAEMGVVVNVSTGCLYCDEDGDTLLSIGGDGSGTTVSLFSAARGEVLQSFRGHTDKVCCVALQGNRIASGGRDKAIRLWSRESGTCEQVLEGCEDPVYALAMRGDLLVSGEGNSKAGKLRYWSLQRGETVSSSAEHAGPIWSVALGINVAVSASYDSSAKVWQLDGPDRLKSIATLSHPNWVFSASVDGQRAATCCWDGFVRLWSLSNFACMHSLSPPLLGSGFSSLKPVYSAQLAGGVLVSGSEEHVRVWSLTSDPPECVATLVHGSKVQGLAFSFKGGFVASAGTGDIKKLYIWRPAQEPTKPMK